MSKKALGKGIDALIHQVEEPEPHDKGEVQKAALRNIEPNPYQPRNRFNEDALAELSESIKQQGVIQPLVVEKNNQGGYTIIAGERRYRAARMAGLSEVPVVVRRFSDEEKLEIALIENIQREDLNPIEEAKAYKQLMDSYELNQEALSRKIGKKRSTVANAVRILKLPEDMQDSIVEGTLSPGHARAILSVLNPADQRILYSRIISDGLSVREAERQAEGFNRGVRFSEKSKGNKGTNRNVSPDVQRIEQQFLDALGTKVSLKGSLEKGKIEISYYSREDLDRVFQLITGD